MSHAKSMPGARTRLKNPSSRFTASQQKLLDRVVGKDWRALERGSQRDNQILDDVIAAYAELATATKKAKQAGRAKPVAKKPVKVSPAVPEPKPRPVKKPVEKPAPRPETKPRPRRERKPAAPRLSDQQYAGMVARLREWFDGYEAADGFRPGRALTTAQKKKVRTDSGFLESFFEVLVHQPPMQRRDFDTMPEALVARQYTPEIRYRRDMKPFAFVYVPGGDETARVWVDAKGHLHVREGDIEQVFMPFSPKELLDPMRVAQQVFAWYPDAISWHARAGQYGVVRNAETARREDGIDGIYGMLKSLQNKYDTHEYDPEDPESSYWRNWMTGVVAYVVHNCKGRGCRDKYRDFVYKLRQASDKRARRAHKQRAKQQGFHPRQNI